MSNFDYFVNFDSTKTIFDEICENNNNTVLSNSIHKRNKYHLQIDAGRYFMASSYRSRGKSYKRFLYVIFGFFIVFFFMQTSLLRYFAEFWPEGSIFFTFVMVDFFWRIQTDVIISFHSGNIRMGKTSR